MQRNVSKQTKPTVTIPSRLKTKYLTPGTDISSSPGQRAVRHGETEQEKEQQPQRLERDRS